MCKPIINWSGSRKGSTRRSSNRNKLEWESEEEYFAIGILYGTFLSKAWDREQILGNTTE
jgi:hypothetical protein